MSNIYTSADQLIGKTPLLELTHIHRVSCVWVKGHAGHPYNERCDRLAVSEAEKFRT